MDLVRYAWQLPTITERDSVAALRVPGGWNNLDGACRNRNMEEYWRGHYANYQDAALRV